MMRFPRDAAADGGAGTAGGDDGDGGGGDGMVTQSARNCAEIRPHLVTALSQFGGNTQASGDMP
jgi:hypothetical protein